MRRRYRGDTLILETEFKTDSGTVLLTDCMHLRAGSTVMVRMVEGKRILRATESSQQEVK